RGRQHPKYLIGPQNGLFPLPQRNAINLIPFDQPLDVLEEIVVKVIDSLEETDLLRLAKHTCRDGLLDYLCPASIFVLVYRGSALPFASEQRASNRRPAEECQVCEMENLVIPVLIRLFDVISQPAAVVNA